MYKYGLHITLFFILCTTAGAMAQIVEQFNESDNQVGICWQTLGISVINSKDGPNGSIGNQKKHLVTNDPEWGTLISPLMFFEAPGEINFKHNISKDDGDDRTLTLYLLDATEAVIDTLFHHVYRAGGSNLGVPATTSLSETIPVPPTYWGTATGPYILKFDWESTGTNMKGVAGIDDIFIDADEYIDPNNDNGDGYCRIDEIILDSACTWDVSVLYKVPTVIVGSTWEWVFGGTSSSGLLDSTVVPGPMDTIIEIQWKDIPGTYSVKVTEIRPGAETNTYDVTYIVTVFESPTVDMVIDSVCESGTPTITFTFDGTGPFTVTYTDGTTVWTDIFLAKTGTAVLPAYTSTQTIEVTDLVDVSGCPPLAYPIKDAVIFPNPNTDPIYHY